MLIGQRLHASLHVGPLPSHPHCRPSLPTPPGLLIKIHLGHGAHVQLRQLEAVAQVAVPRRGRHHRHAAQLHRGRQGGVGAEEVQRRGGGNVGTNADCNYSPSEPGY